WIPAKAGVDPASVKSIAQGLNDVLENQQVYRQWLKENRGTIQSGFDRSAYLAKYNKFIRALLACLKGTDAAQCL
ncbi:MAG: hypothetical protein QX199_16510, partial [Methylococcaceae bacterium]